MLEYGLGAIVVAALLLGIVQFLKEQLDLEGKSVKWLTLVIGFVLFGLAYGVNEQLLPAAWVPYILWVTFSLAAPLAAMGYYKLGKDGFGGLTSTRRRK